MNTIGPFLREFKFYVTIALCCTLLDQIFHLCLGDRQLPFAQQVLLVWSVGSAAFYSYGSFLEWLRGDPRLRARFNVRREPVRPQPVPPFTARGVLRGELKAMLLFAAVLGLAREEHRSHDLLPSFAWFLMQIAAADLSIYIVHRLLHTRRLRWIHRKHHEYRDTSTWVAAHKTTIELILFTFADLIPIYVCKYDLSQLCAWLVIGTLYNLEGHSSLSVFFIPGDIHDRHHTAYRGNYGIQGIWDRLCGTLLPPLGARPK